MWMCPTQAHRVEVFWMPAGLSEEALANFIQWGQFVGQNGKSVVVKIFKAFPEKSIFHIKIWSPTCVLVRYRQDLGWQFLGKCTFLHTLFWPKMAFFGPEGPNLAQNIKNIVWQVVLTQNMTSQSQNWSRVEMDNFGFSRPPKTTRGPPRAPRGPQESKNGPNHQ